MIKIKCLPFYIFMVNNIGISRKANVGPCRYLRSYRVLGVSRETFCVHKYGKTLVLLLVYIVHRRVI